MPVGEILLKSGIPLSNEALLAAYLALEIWTKLSIDPKCGPQNALNMGKYRR
jgi:hypothetical protein